MTCDEVINVLFRLSYKYVLITFYTCNATYYVLLQGVLKVQIVLDTNIAVFNRF